MNDLLSQGESGELGREGGEKKRRKRCEIIPTVAIKEMNGNFLYRGRLTTGRKKKRNGPW